MACSFRFPYLITSTAIGVAQKLMARQEGQRCKQDELARKHARLQSKFKRSQRACKIYFDKAMLWRSRAHAMQDDLAYLRGRNPRQGPLDESEDEMASLLEAVGSDDDEVSPMKTFILPVHLRMVRLT